MATGSSGDMSGTGATLVMVMVEVSTGGRGAEPYTDIGTVSLNRTSLSFGLLIKSL